VETVRHDGGLVARPGIWHTVVVERAGKGSPSAFFARASELPPYS
jgi:hypothetical protein